MESIRQPRPATKAYIYGYYRDEPIPTSNLHVVVDCTNPDVLSDNGYLHGDSLSRALNAVITAKRNQGRHNWHLCDDYYVTYIDAEGVPLRADRWIRIDPEGWPAKSRDAAQLAIVTPTQVYRQCELLGGMSHLLHV